MKTTSKDNKNYNKEEISFIKEKLFDIYNRKAPPDEFSFSELLKKINTTFDKEDTNIRPKSSNDYPGGLVYLKDLPTFIIPDLHARRDFFLSILLSEHENKIILENLFENKIQIVCVGDGVHSEGRALQRWLKAYEEFKVNYIIHSNMDEEINESFGLMEMVIEAKIQFPNNFHFLKGNHENILNETGKGNYSFRKFVMEGAMVLHYLEKFYSKDFIQRYSGFEKSLPVFAVGKNFLVSHAQPLNFYTKEEVINFKNNNELILGFTWTDNGKADEEVVFRMLNEYAVEKNSSYYFAGHRPVKELYNTGCNGRFVQIHNPNKFVVAKIWSTINLEKDIFEIKNLLN